MVAIPHFMRERRKHSQTIVWLCHRKLFQLRIVLHLQTPPSSTSLCLKSCCDRCQDNWAIGIVRVTGVCASPGRREPSRGGKPLLHPNEPCGFISSSFTCVKPRGAGSGVKGPRADAPVSGRGSRSPIPPTGLSTSPARKLQPLSLVRGDGANK